MAKFQRSICWKNKPQIPETSVNYIYRFEFYTSSAAFNTHTHENTLELREKKWLQKSWTILAGSLQTIVRSAKPTKRYLLCVLQHITLMSDSSIGEWIDWNTATGRTTKWKKPWHLDDIPNQASCSSQQPVNPNEESRQPHRPFPPNLSFSLTNTHAPALYTHCIFCTCQQ